MEKDIVIGIPRGLLYYRYKYLWEKFFSILRIDVLISGETNKSILENGLKIALDESCLALKIFIGHVNELVNKCDYILIPRIVSVKKKEKLCTNFSVLYDLMATLFNTNILTFEIDVDNHIKEVDAFISLGKFLGVSRIKSILAYNAAKKYDKEVRRKQALKQNVLLTSNKKKILLVGHPYNLHDEYIGNTIIKFLEKNNIATILSDIYSGVRIEFEATSISKSCYWTFNKELLGAITHYKNSVDGIIIISSFPCGPDSLTNEMIIRTVKDKPISTIVIDELSNDLGIQTRLESFIDIIKLGDEKT